MCTEDGWPLHSIEAGTHGSELGRCPPKVPSVPGIHLVLSKCSFSFPKILYTQLGDEVTFEFPNMGSGREGTERKVQRPVGHTVCGLNSVLSANATIDDA